VKKKEEVVVEKRGEVVDVWDEPPFVPRQGHCSPTHNVDTPETARIRTFGPPADRPPSAPPSAVSDESGRNAFFYASFH